MTAAFVTVFLALVALLLAGIAATRPPASRKPEDEQDDERPWM